MARNGVGGFKLVVRGGYGNDELERFQAGRASLVCFGIEWRWAEMNMSSFDFSAKHTSLLPKRGHLHTYERGLGCFALVFLNSYWTCVFLSFLVS